MRFWARLATNGGQDMSLGTILVSVAALILVAAYVARPFRSVRVDGDRVIDTWVRQVRSDSVAVDDRSEPVGVEGAVIAQRDADLPVSQLPRAAGARAAGAVPVGAIDRDEPVNFCPYCGRRVAPDHVFCRGCGRQLAEGDPR